MNGSLFPLELTCRHTHMHTHACKCAPNWAGPTGVCSVDWINGLVFPVLIQQYHYVRAPLSTAVWSTHMTFLYFAVLAFFSLFFFQLSVCSQLTSQLK